jgi:hypothetical protein
MAYSWFILLFTISGTALILLLLHGTFLGQALHERIPDRPRRQLFVAWVSFLLTFGGVRAVVYAILHQIPPFHFIEARGATFITSSSGSSFSCWWDTGDTVVV